MSLILTQKQLDKLVCSVCDKYLSVLPVKVYKNDTNNIIKCGRCSLPKDNGVDSIYTKIAERFLFKCVNSYAGCRKLLPSSEVMLHEEKCLSDPYQCPNCAQCIKSAYELIQHYKRKHRSCTMVNNSFNLMLSDEITKKEYLLVIEDFIFFIHVIFEPKSPTLRLSAVALRDFGAEVFYKFKIKTINYGDTKETETKSCSTLAAFNESDYICFHFGDITVGLLKIEIILDISTISDPVYEVARPEIPPGKEFEGCKGFASSKTMETT